jgi:cell wall-associated NlpC family hydrolase
MIEPQVNIKEKPDGRTPTIIQAPIGCLLLLAKNENGWYQVTLPGQNQGWVPQTMAKKITDGKSIPSGSINEITATARKLLGTPYLWGGMTKAGIDCSGLMYQVYYVNGLQLPRDADQQFNIGQPVNVLSNLAPGDLVFFSTSGPPPSHVGMYLGNGLFIHASSHTKGVAISKLNDYMDIYLGARRYLNYSE